MTINFEKNNKFYKIVITFFCIVLAIFFVSTLFNYQGNKVIYTIFTIVFNLLIFNFLLRKTSFYEIFFGILIWLGFWFKFSVFESHIYRLHSIFDGRALCNFDQNNFDKILIISSIGCAGFLLSILFANYLKKKYFLFQLKI